MLDLWRSELSGHVSTWSLLLSAPGVEVAHDEMVAYEGAGTATTFLLLQASEQVASRRIGWDSPGLPSDDGSSTTLREVCRAAARAGRTPGPDEPAAVTALVEALGGADAVNERLQRIGHLTRVRPDGSSRVLPSEHAEAMAALTGNPAYVEARDLLSPALPWGLGAHLAPGAPFRHRHAVAAGLRHDGGTLLLPEDTDLTVHCFTDGAAPAADGSTAAADPVLAAMGRAMAGSLRLLGHDHLVVDPV